MRPSSLRPSSPFPFSEKMNVHPNARQKKRLLPSSSSPKNALNESCLVQTKKAGGTVTLPPCSFLPCAPHPPRPPLPSMIFHAAASPSSLPSPPPLVFPHHVSSPPFLPKRRTLGSLRSFLFSFLHRTPLVSLYGRLADTHNDSSLGGVPTLPSFASALYHYHALPCTEPLSVRSLLFLSLLPNLCPRHSP
eukprot:RCo020170